MPIAPSAPTSPPLMDRTRPSAPYDVSTLAWVLEELRKTLESSHKGLRRYLREAEASGADAHDELEPASLRHARQQMHQGVGALELVNIPEGALLLRAAEGLIQRWVTKPGKVDTAGVEAVEQASFALIDYLTRRLAGKTVEPLGLFPALRRLHELQQAERSHPADLWTHDWRWRDIAGPSEPIWQPDARMQAEFERRILLLVRSGDATAAQALTHDSAMLGAGAMARGLGMEATFWRLAAGFFEAWGLGLLRSDNYTKRTGSRVMAQLRAMVKGTAELSDQLAQDLLFFCAHAWPSAQQSAPALRAVQYAYHLQPPESSDYDTPRYGLHDPALLTQARKRVNAAKDAWSAAAGGEEPALSHLVEAFAPLSDSIHQLWPGGEALGAVLHHVASSTQKSGRAPAPALAMEVATSLLYLGAAVEDGDLDAPEQATRTVHLAQRIESVAAGQPAQPLNPWMEELYRRVSDRQTLGSVVHELRATLGEVERIVDPYFRHPEGATVLVGVPGQLGQMRSVLSVLDLPAAMQTVLRMRDDVNALLHPLAREEEDPWPLYQRLAGNLGALGFLLDMLAVQPVLARSLFRFDPLTGVLTPVMGRSQLAPDVIDRAQAIAEGLRQDDVPLEQVSDALQALAERRDVSAQPDLAAHLHSAQAVIEQAEATPDGPEGLGSVREHLAQTMEDFVANATAPMALDPLVPAPVVALESTSQLLSLDGFAADDTATGLEDDGEMLAVFLEESAEVMAEARVALDTLRTLPADAMAQTALRRAFHTLKGSARMVGLDTFAEAAWSGEQLYNHWLAEQRPASADLIGLTGEALDHLEDWTQAIAEGRDAQRSAAPLVNAADALRLHGERLPLAAETGALTFTEQAAPVEPPTDTLPPAAPTVLDLAAPESVPTGEVAELSEVDLELFQDGPPPSIVETLHATRPADLNSTWTATEVVDRPVSASDFAPPTGVDLLLDDAAAQPVTLPAADPVPVDDIRTIGTLQVSTALLDIFLGEAEEQSQRLDAELQAWSTALGHPVSEQAVAAAHSLAGNAATVGHTALADHARALEHALVDARALGQGAPADAELFQAVAQDLRRMLHLFAADTLAEPQPDLVERLHDWRNDARARLALRHTEPAFEPAASDAVFTPAPQVESHPVLPLEVSATHHLHANKPPLVIDADGDIDQHDHVDTDLFPIFEEEAEELLPRLTDAMHTWQASGGHDAEAAQACMRALHTFKGSARLAGAMRLGEMAHRFESAVTRRLQPVDGAPVSMDDLQQRCDALVSAFEQLRQAHGAGLTATQYAGLQSPDSVMGELTSGPMPLGGHELDTCDEPDPFADSISGELPELPSQTTESETVSPASPDAASAIDWSRFTAKVPEAPNGDRPPMAVQPVRVRASLLDRLVNLAGEVSITRSRLEVEIGQIRGSMVDLTDNLERLNRQLHDIALQAETQLASRREAARAAAQEFDPLELDRYTRLQELTRMMAESVNDVATVRSALQRTLQTTEDELAMQARLTRELQTDLLRTRMVEFESLSDRLYRVVRQAAKETGKQVRFDIVGGSIEVDRGVLDRMTPAFEHLLRNCVTHGVEAPTDRQNAGKDPTGSIVVSLEQEGNEVTVEVRDDGAGLDLERIRAKAVEMGLLAADAPIDDKELAQFIFTPGLTTVTELTELAGRGVGMDVVRSDVQSLGGRVETRTQPGKGTRFKLVMPLTTVVTQVVLLRAGSTTIAVPSNLVELVQRVPTAQMERCYDSGTYLYGGLKLPFYWLGALLHSSGRGVEVGRTQAVVVVRSAQQRVALHVDEVLGSHEVVVKNLGPQLSRVPCLAGMTLLASGVVALIYNPLALAAVYGTSAAAWMKRALHQPGAVDSQHADLHPPAPLVLVVDDSLTVRRVTKRLLEREGYRVTVAKDGLEALEALTGERPVVVLSDIEMPRMDGFDLLRNIRADAKLGDLPVIMVTSRIAQKHRDYATELGVNHYLGKPYDDDELLKLIKAYT